MSAQILPFDRAKVLHAELNLDESLRRVRMAARAAGCTTYEVEQVQRYAVRLWCDAALDGAFVVEKARDFAAQLVATRAAGPEVA
jgi:hypothetical protein